MYVSFKGLKIQPQVVYNVVSKAKCKVSVKVVSSIPNNEKQDVELFFQVQAVIFVLLLVIYVVD